MANDRIGPETRERIRVAWEDILDDIAAGELIRVTLAKRNITRNMIRAYLGSEPPIVRQQWDMAQEASADAYLEEIRELTTNRSHLDPASARVNMDGLKWLAAKRNPKRYSDKSMIDMNIRTVDLTRIIADANTRLVASREIGQAIASTAVRVLELEDIL